MDKFFSIDNYEVNSTKFNYLMMDVTHTSRRGTKGILLRTTPVEVTDMGVNYLFDFSDNPLTSGMDLLFIPLARKNQKRMDAAFAELCEKAPAIVDLWNKRDFDAIKKIQWQQAA